MEPVLSETTRPNLATKQQQSLETNMSSIVHTLEAAEDFLLSSNVWSGGASKVWFTLNYRISHIHKTSFKSCSGTRVLSLFLLSSHFSFTKENCSPIQQIKSCCHATTSSNAVSLLKSLATYCRYLKLTFQFQRSFFLLKTNKQTNKKLLILPWWSNGEDSTISIEGVWVWSLLGELIPTIQVAKD